MGCVWGGGSPGFLICKMGGLLSPPAAVNCFSEAPGTCRWWQMLVSEALWGPVEMRHHPGTVLGPSLVLRPGAWKEDLTLPLAPCAQCRWKSGGGSRPALLFSVQFCPQEVGSEGALLSPRVSCLVQRQTCWPPLGLGLKPRSSASGNSET